jgi:hypothetical protein
LLKSLHVGPRFNFMKTVPVITEMSRDPGRVEQLLIHTC